MKRSFKFKQMRATAALSTALLVACGSSGGGGGGGSGGGVDPDLVLGAASTDSGNTHFPQTVAMQDSDTNEFFPGQANVWDISRDFSLGDGGDDQFDGALELSVNSIAFSGQSYTDLTFYTPGVQAADGVRVAAVVQQAGTNYKNRGTVSAISGTYSVQLNDIFDGRLSQRVDLTSAATPITLHWSWDILTVNGYFTGISDHINVVVRDGTSGAVLDTLFSASGFSRASYYLSLDAYAGQSVIISFEISSSGFGPSLVDDISVMDNASVEYITNGDFETGDLSGWTVNDPVELQNMTSSPETIAGLDVTRSFYTVPDKLWGRWVDVFENPTADAITATVAYHTNLGSDDCGILYENLGTSGQALTGWDGTAQPAVPDPNSSNNDRDFALVFGSVNHLYFTPATGIGVCDGSDDITHEFTITVEPGGRVALVNFILMNGIDTGETAADETALATAIDAEASKIVTDFWTDGQYRTGMTQAQVNAIENF